MRFAVCGLFALAAVLVGPPASAAPLTFSCTPGPATCNGATYALAITSKTAVGGGSYRYEVVYGINTSGYLHGATDYIHAVSFKNLVDDMSGITLLDAPGGVGAWKVFELGLNANGCKDGHGEEAACAEATGFGAAVSPGQIYWWTFSFLSTDSTPSATGHIKYLYVTNTMIQKKGKPSEFDKVGDLGSWDIAVQTPPSQVPEPFSLLLLGTGLGAAVARLRRRSS